MAWYEYTTWKNNIAAIWADVRKGLDWFAKRRARRDEAIKIEMRTEIVKATTEIYKLLSQLMDSMQKHDEIQNRRLTELEKKLGIPTGDNALAGAPISEQNRRLIEALLQPAPPTAQRPALAPLSMAPRLPKDWAKGGA